MGFFEELIKKIIRNILFQKPYRDTELVCIIPGASDLIPLWKPHPWIPGYKSFPARIVSACHSSCPHFLPGDFSEKKKILSLFGIQIKLQTTVCHPGTLAICSLSKPQPIPRNDLRRLLPAGLVSSELCSQHPLRDCLSLMHVINRRGQDPECSQCLLLGDT